MLEGIEALERLGKQSPYNRLGELDSFLESLRVMHLLGLGSGLWKGADSAPREGDMAWVHKFQ